MLFRNVLVACSLLALMAPAAIAEEAQAAATEAPALVQNLPAITVSPVTMSHLVDRVFAAGLIGPVETVLVQPQVQGLAIESIAAEVGDWVTEGQVLTRLSSTELNLQKSQLTASRASAEAAIAQAEAQLVDAESAAAEAERVLTRTRALKDQGNVSQAAFDAATASTTSARARVSVATQGLAAARAQLTLVDAQVADIDLKLKRTEVVAPVAGEVVERNAMIGAIAVSGGEPMFRIVKDGELELLADVAETDILKLKVGQPASLRFVGLADAVPGKVRLVEPRVDAASRLGRVRIWIEASDAVRSGMFADATIVVSEGDRAAIPVTALSGGTGGTFTMKVTDGLVERVAIRTGVRDHALVEVTEGLAVGDSVVTKAGAFVRDGDRINPVPEAAPATE
jgi:HlyD family secretion protein